MGDVGIGDLAKLKNSGQYAPTFLIVAETGDGRLIGKDPKYPKLDPLVAQKDDWERVEKETI